MTVKCLAFVWMPASVQGSVDTEEDKAKKMYTPGDVDGASADEMVAAFTNSE